MKSTIKRIISLLTAVICCVSVCFAAYGTKVEDSAARQSAEPAFIELEDGEYAIPVTLEGGSGKSTVTSPAPMSISDGKATLTLVWSSEFYDYMISGGKKYLPINEDGYSTFEIPVTSFDEPMTIIADTTAMSEPHEVEYIMTLYPDEIMAGNETPQAAAQRVVFMAFGIIALCAVVSAVKKIRR